MKAVKLQSFDRQSLLGKATVAAHCERFDSWCFLIYRKVMFLFSPLKWSNWPWKLKAMQHQKTCKWENAYREKKKCCKHRKHNQIQDHNSLGLVINAPRSGSMFHCWITWLLTDNTFTKFAFQRLTIGTLKRNLTLKERELKEKFNIMLLSAVQRSIQSLMQEQLP